MGNAGVAGAGDGGGDVQQECDQQDKLDTGDKKVDEENSRRGSLWHFLEIECDPDERMLVRDFLLPTAAALALSLQQVRMASQYRMKKNSLNIQNLR